MRERVKDLGMVLEVADVEHLLRVLEVVLALILQLSVEAIYAAEICVEKRRGLSIDDSEKASTKRDPPGMPQLTLMPAPLRTTIRWLFWMSLTASSHVLY